MILVTGAAGKTGWAVVRTLVARGKVVRALVHRYDQVPKVETLGVRDVLVGDADAGTILDDVLTCGNGANGYLVAKGDRCAGGNTQGWLAIAANDDPILGTRTWSSDTGFDVVLHRFAAADGAAYSAYACQHLHGGGGIDVDYPLHRYFKWATQIEHELAEMLASCERDALDAGAALERRVDGGLQRVGVAASVAAVGGDHRRARWRADAGGGKGVGPAAALGSQPVDVGRPVVRASLGPEVPPPEIVDQDVENIGGLAAVLLAKLGQFVVHFPVRIMATSEWVL